MGIIALKISSMFSCKYRSRNTVVQLLFFGVTLKYKQFSAVPCLDVQRSTTCAVYCSLLI